MCFCFFGFGGGGNFDTCRHITSPLGVQACYPTRTIPGIQAKPGSIRGWEKCPLDETLISQRKSEAGLKHLPLDFPPPGASVELCRWPRSRAHPGPAQRLSPVSSRWAEADTFSRKRAPGRRLGKMGRSRKDHTNSVSLAPSSMVLRPYLCSHLNIWGKLGALRIASPGKKKWEIQPYWKANSQPHVWPDPRVFRGPSEAFWARETAGNQPFCQPFGGSWLSKPERFN